MNQTSRFGYIDALRGIAVLLVIWLHVSEVYKELSPSVKEKGLFLYDLAWTMNVGRIGVVIFFSISGFVLLKSIKGDKLKGTKTFIIRRFLRLYPAFWVSVLFGIFTMQLVGENISFEKIVANLTMLPLMFNQDMILGLYWTLEVEWIFYFLGLLLFLIGASQKPVYLFTISILFLIIFIILKQLKLDLQAHIGLIVLPFHLSIMFWGALFRYFHDNPDFTVHIFNKQISIKALFITLTIILLMIPVIAFTKGLITDNFKLIQLGISYFFGISIFIFFSIIYKIKNKFLIWIGTISYSMYLFHPIVFYTLFWWLQNYAPTILTEMNLGIYIIVNIVLSIIFSSIVYYLVEKPNIRLSHHLTSYR